MGYTVRTTDNAGDLGRATDQNESVNNDIYLKGELDKFVGARVRNTANQSINHNTTTALTFDTEVFDTDAIFDAGSPTRLTCKTAGKYLIMGHMVFAENATLGRYAEIRLNGAATYLCTTAIRANTGAGWTTSVDVATIYHLAVNDYVEFRVLQDSGGALNSLTANPQSPVFMMQRLGP